MKSQTVIPYRKSAGLSRKALAAQIGISVDQLGKIETGKKFTTLKTLFLIADKLNIPIEFILQDNCSQSALFVLKNLLTNAENQLDYRQKEILFDIIDKVIYFIKLSKE